MCVVVVYVCGGGVCVWWWCMCVVLQMFVCDACVDCVCVNIVQEVRAGEH